MTDVAKREEPSIVVIPVQSGPRHVTETRTVIEKRAPTDESVRLLREMETKAEAEVVKAVVVGNTTFECVVHISRDNLSNRTNLRAIFKLNGKQMKAEHSASAADIDKSAMAIRGMWEGLRDEVAKTIAEEVLEQAFRAAAWR